MALVENENEGKNESRCKRERESVKGGPRFSWRESQRQLKGPKGHLRHRGSQGQLEGNSSWWNYRASSSEEALSKE